MIVLPPVPKMYIGYQRFSLKGIEEDIRITFMVGTCIKSNTIYYQVHSLSAEEENQVSLFLKDLME